MPDAEAMPFWASASGDSDTEDLAAWLRDVGGDGSGRVGRRRQFELADPDASWLGAAPRRPDERRRRRRRGPTPGAAVEAGRLTEARALPA